VGDPVIDTRAGRRRAFRRVAIAAFVLLLPLAAHAVWDQMEANRFARLVKELRARGEPVDFAEERRPLATDEERQASRLYYAAAMLAADAVPRVKAFASGGMSNPRQGLAEALRELARVPGGVPRDDPRFQQLQAEVEQATTALMLLDRATPLTFERFSPERGTYSYQTSDLFQLASINSLRTDLYSLQADIRNATSAQFASVRLQRTLKGLTRMLYVGTFGSLQLLLQRTSPDAASLAKLQNAYERVASDDGLAEDLTARRAQVIESVWPTTARPLFVQRVRSPWPWHPGNDSLMFVALRPWITHRLVAYLRELDRAIAIVRESWPEKLRGEQLADAASSASRQATMPAGGWLYQVSVLRSAARLLTERAGDMLPGGTISRAGRTLAQNRAAVMALAIERWRRVHGGALPPTLGALVPAYLREIPRDPFTGAALKFIRTADSYTVYSIGIDRVDNAGDIGEWQPDVRGFSRGSEHDIGIRVPLHRPAEASAATQAEFVNR
jgi:hypothetical protein